MLRICGKDSLSYKIFVEIVFFLIHIMVVKTTTGEVTFLSLLMITLVHLLLYLIIKRIVKIKQNNS